VYGQGQCDCQQLEERLRLQTDLTDRRAVKDIAMESQALEELEEEEATETLALDTSLDGLAL
jgi:hypothetical protein